MITLEQFKGIDNEVAVAVNETLDFLKNDRQDHSYLLVLAEGEFKPELLNPKLKLNPYVIDDFSDKSKDNTRINFWVRFLRNYYSFPNGQQGIDDDRYRIHLEMMIYAHLWESKPFLKKLFRLAGIVDNESYSWIVEIPEMSRHELIRKDIRDRLKKYGLSLAEVKQRDFILHFEMPSLILSIALMIIGME